MVARLRRAWWRYIRRHHGEVCGECGRPVNYVWLADDYIWERVAGNGVWCIPCFDRAAYDLGLELTWDTHLTRETGPATRMYRKTGVML